MRKKSHISLARYMVECLNDAELRRHKLSFYLGSILPDIKPSFVYRRHEINGTFPSIRKHIARLSEGEKVIEKKGRKYYMDLGQISHYLADYFTFPHNESYPGSLKDHCSYEEQLKHDLRSYLKDRQAVRAYKVAQLAGRMEEQSRQAQEVFGNSEALCNFIQRMHDDYIGRKHDVEDDIMHIVEVNQRTLAAMMELLARNRAEYRVRHS